MKLLLWTRGSKRIPRELVAGIAVVLMIVWFVRAKIEPPKIEELPTNETQATTVDQQWPQYTEKEQAAKAPTVDAPVTIHVYDAARDQVVDMDMEDYIKGVVAAEVPASYNLEAIKAQAVAARTYAFQDMRAYGGGGCNQDSKADVCTSSSHCQAYASKEQLKKKWGNQYDRYWATICLAVQATEGEVIAYQGKPIHALFHAVSGGRTEDALAVFNMNLPYLTSVESQGEEVAPRYKQTFRYTRIELAQKINKAYPSAKVTAGKLQSQLEIVSHLQSGQVDQMRIGKVTIDGRDFRKITGIASANFSIGYDPTNVVIYTVGFGHGVGMSQAGANAMAAKGSDYQEIVAHYYVGTEICKMSVWTQK